MKYPTDAYPPMDSAGGAERKDDIPEQQNDEKVMIDESLFTHIVKNGSQHTINVTTITAMVLAAFCSFDFPLFLCLRRNTWTCSFALNDSNFSFSSV